MSMADRYVNADEYSKEYDEKKMTQKEACLDYLERYGSITPLEALMAFNSFRLAAIICELRKDGHPIETTLDEGRKKYAIYTLVREEVEYDG